jgi:hypothetical protein
MAAAAASARLRQVELILDRDVRRERVDDRAVFLK